MIKKIDVMAILTDHATACNARILGRLMPYMKDVLAGDISAIPEETITFCMYEIAAIDSIEDIKTEVEALPDS